MSGKGSCVFKMANAGDVQSLRGLAETESGAAEIRGCFAPSTGDTVAHNAARSGNCDLLAMLVGSRLLSADVSNFDGKRPLHDAAQFGHAACVRYLLAVGAEVDALKRADWTPLMLACTQQSLEVVELLLQHRADPCLQNKDGWNCFHIACREGSPGIIRRLLDAAPNVWNTRSNNGRTPLHTVALHGHVAALNILLATCCYDVNGRDSCGSTPFMDAAKGGYTDMMAALKETGQVDVLARDVMGRLAIHAAAECGHVAAVLALVRNYGIDVDAQMLSTCSTCLHLAAKEGHDAVISSLVELGANVDALDARGRTALHIASSCQRALCVRELLKAGATDHPDMTGVRARDMARKSDVIEAFT